MQPVVAFRKQRSQSLNTAKCSRANHAARIDGGAKSPISVNGRAYPRHEYLQAYTSTPPGSESSRRLQRCSFQNDSGRCRVFRGRQARSGHDLAGVIDHVCRNHQTNLVLLDDRRGCVMICVLLCIVFLQR